MQLIPVFVGCFPKELLRVHMSRVGSVPWLNKAINQFTYVILGLDELINELLLEIVYKVCYVL